MTSCRLLNCVALCNVPNVTARLSTTSRAGARIPRTPRPGGGPHDPQGPHVTTGQFFYRPYSITSHYFLKKIVKIVATRCQILSLKCTKFDFGWAPDPAGGAYSAPPDPLAGFKGAYF